MTGLEPFPSNYESPKQGQYMFPLMYRSSGDKILLWEWKWNEEKSLPMMHNIKFKAEEEGTEG